jgi:hypothetical protein
MSRNNKLGQIRRSQVLGYGPGAIIDFRAGKDGGGPVSVVAASLESWDETARLKGTSDPHLIHEARLEKVLEKNYFRLPPIDDSDDDDEQMNRWLRGYRFPTWLLCPECKELKRANKWTNEMGDPSRWCARCSNAQRRVFVVPVRFVTACENSHLDEFPWNWWLKTRSPHPPVCSQGGEGECRLVLESSGGSGLESLFIRCRAKGCGARASMGGAFSQNALKGLSCSGRQPWLTNKPETCTAVPRALQRGASNLYFPSTYSTLSIPPWSDSIQRDIEAMWRSVVQSTEPVRTQMLQALAATNASIHGMTPEQYVSVLRERLRLEEEVSLDTLRYEEFVRLRSESADRTFQVRQEQLPDEWDRFDRLVRVERLREVRALTGFKRIYQPASVQDPGRGRFGNLAKPATPKDWLPAIEVNGEGIFLSLAEPFVTSWAGGAAVTERVRRINEAHERQWKQAHGAGTEPEPITAEHVLVHSLAHALIKRLAFECGYDAASLRERLFVRRDPWMAGLLIYTSTSDADGTLGGLERQGRSERFTQILRAALEEVSWCSSDPLCQNGISSLSESLNLAACHSCLLLPETSCELGNRFLDRALLVGNTASGRTGYFDQAEELARMEAAE